MTANALTQLAVYLGLLTLLAWPLGVYMSWAYEGRLSKPAATNPLALLERLTYRLAGVDPRAEMTWLVYAGCMLAFNAVGFLACFVLLRLQGVLPLNPQSLPAVPPDLAFNTAISFATNTNWQAYGGESTLSYLPQMLALTVQNFVSAAAGMAVLVALVRGFTRKQERTIGNFWVDLVRSVVFILLPLSLLLAVALASQGVVQNFSAYKTATLLQPTRDDAGKPRTEQTLPMGPAASQIAIKQLGTNGGGFFNVNSSHPYENPTAVSNFLQLLSILLIPAALCVTFGALVKDGRQGWAIYAAMLLLFAPLAIGCYAAEQGGVSSAKGLGVDVAASAEQAGGNMEGKETRFGIANSALWATATTAASNGSVNAMHDSFTPLGGMIPMWLMQVGEVIFGGVGSGLYGMIVFALVAVFIAGLMIGRTPEYLGKKIEAFEVKMAALIILVPPLVVLAGTSVAVLGPGLVGPVGNETKPLLENRGPHGFSEVLYAFSSAGNNNGSAFAGLNANNPFYNTALGVAMFFARYWLAVPVLALAGSLAAKKTTPVSAGTLPTHDPLFVVLLAGIVVVVGALTFIPALALGPVVEHLRMIAAQ